MVAASLFAAFVVVACGKSRGEPCGHVQLSQGRERTDDCKKGLVCLYTDANTRPICETQRRADEWCSDKPACTDDGRCRYRAGTCVTTDADCRKSTQCSKLGLCRAATNKACLAGSADDCRKSSACAESGFCTFKSSGDGLGSCVVGSDEDCEKSSACTRESRCRLEKKTGLCAKVP